ncbi:MAG TPA: adenylosuccinate synthetase [Candidatus Cybelea sp.]|jgi:adenylosuccinate synthase|nr:adenylosuccinate synthetase [Candidatus Cybelea sp.]
MSLWVVVGGQYGSEGKGKIAAVIAQQHDVDIAIRCGGPNSGHSFVAADGSTALVRQLPTAYINRRTRLLIPAGALIDLGVLKYEIDSLSIPPSRVGVDRRAMIIEQADKETETEQHLRERLSSTLCGVGAAVARRVMRTADVRLAADAALSTPWLAPLLTDVSKEANAMLDRDGKVIVEGTQGFGLSLFHSDHYPKTTSRDTTAAAFLSEVGISPLRVSEIILVMRTFPIRVAGAQAGPLREEITWAQLQNESHSPYPIAEFTTVTKALRRVGRFDWNLATNAVNLNRPTSIAVNCIDHLGFVNRGVRSYSELTEDARAFITRLEVELGSPVGYIGVGPALSDVLLREPRSRRRSQPANEQLAS